MGLGQRTTAESLRASTRAVLQLAEENGIKTLAFPAVGTGIAGFDVTRCAQIMIEQVRAHLAGKTNLTDVYFVLFDPKSYQAFLDAYEQTR